MKKLQYAAVGKCTGVVVGARKEYVRKVAAVEDVEMFARASAGRFLARTICDLSWAGVAECGDTAVVGKGPLSLVGPCWRGKVATIDLGLGSGGLGVDWEGAISSVREGCLIAYTDSSRDGFGRVAGACCGLRMLMIVYS